MEVLILVAAYLVARVLGAVLKTGANVVCGAYPALLLMAALQNWEQIPVYYPTFDLILIASACGIFALIRYGLLQGLRPLRRKLCWNHYLRLKSNIADRRDLAKWFGRPFTLDHEAREASDLRLEVLEMRKGRQESNAAFWGRSWQLATVGIFGTMIALLPIWVVGALVRAGWRNRRHAPEAAQIALPFVAMVGVTLCPSWWWALVLLQMAYVCLKLAATAYHAANFVRDCKPYSPWHHEPLSFWQAVDQVIAYDFLWKKAKKLPYVYLYALPVAVVAWLGFGIFSWIEPAFTSWAAVEFTIFVSVVLTAVAVVPPGFFVGRWVHRITERIKPMEEPAYEDVREYAEST